MRAGDGHSLREVPKVGSVWWFPSSLTRLLVDEDDPDGQSLLFWYPSVSAGLDAYLRPAIKTESGAKSALDPNDALTIPG